MNKPLHIVSIVGARPQFVKLAPMSRAFDQHEEYLKHTIIHTGQHYDDNMSTVFFDELNIARPDVNLDIGSGSHAIQTGKMMEKLECWFDQYKPNVVLVYGDTNSTLAACLAATKIHVKVAHVEAGLRSFNRHMPEEINRVATDHCSDRLYAPTPASIENLQSENLAARAIQSGDVMRDAVQHNLQLAESRGKSAVQANTSEYGVLTLHRPSNTEPEVLRELLVSIDKIAQKGVPLLFPVHPRTRSVIDGLNLTLTSAVELIDPLAYLDLLVNVKEARVVLTDSGGLQKEAAFLGTPCITLREETEWIETIAIGVNQLVGTNPVKLQGAVETVLNRFTGFDAEMHQALNHSFGSGNAAHVIADDLIETFC